MCLPGVFVESTNKPYPSTHRPNFISVSCHHHHPPPSLFCCITENVSLTFSIREHSSLHVTLSTMYTRVSHHHHGPKTVYQIYVVEQGSITDNCKQKISALSAREFLYARSVTHTYRTHNNTKSVPRIPHGCCG